MTLAGNTGPASAATASTTITRDTTAPTVTGFSSTESSPTSSASIAYTLTFSESVTGVASGDLTNTGTATGCSFAVSGSGTTFTVTVSGCTDSGTIIPQFAAGGATDAAGNTGPASAATSSTSLSYVLQYTATFNSNGGSGSMTAQTSASAANLTANSFTRAGYTFDGWNTVANGSGTPYANSASYPFTSSVTLYAQWSANTLTVTTNEVGGSAISNPTTTTGGSLADPGSPTRSGYTFDGWFTAVSGGTAISFPYEHGQTANFTIYAQWTGNTYTVTYDSNGSTGGTAPSSGTATFGSSFTASTNSGTLTRSGYTFGGWNTAANGSGTNFTAGGSTTWNRASDTTLYAKWTEAACWTLRHNSGMSSFDWNGITYGDGLFVAVGGSGVMTSTDGTSWTSRTAPASGAEGWSAVTYSAEKDLFVAVSPSSPSGSRVITSPDGITWTARTAPSQIWNAITYGGGKFVVVGSRGRFMYSENGIDWTSGSTDDIDWTSVTYGDPGSGGMFVAVAPASFSPSDRVMTSSTGTSWTLRSAPISNLYSVAFGDGKFVAVTANGTGQYAVTSTSGMFWSLQTMGPDDIGTTSWVVTYGDGKFIAVTSNTPTKQARTSADGITWREVITPTPTESWRAVAYGNGKFVAVATRVVGSGNQVMNADSACFG